MRSPGNHFDKILVPLVAKTKVPCLLSDGEQIFDRQDLTPLEYEQKLQDVNLVLSRSTWVESCICYVPGSDYDLFVLSEHGDVINCIHQNINLGTTTWLTNIEGVQYEFKERIEAVAACLAFAL